MKYEDNTAPVCALDYPKLKYLSQLAKIPIHPKCTIFRFNLWSKSLKHEVGAVPTFPRTETTATGRTMSSTIVSPVPPFLHAANEAGGSDKEAGGGAK